MSQNDGKTSQNGENGQDNSDSLSNSASRARNKTVMLTPEMTGKLRGMIAKDANSGSESNAGAESKGTSNASQWESPLKAQPLKPKNSPLAPVKDAITIPPAGSVPGAAMPSPLTPAAASPAAMPSVNNVSTAQASTPQSPVSSSPSLGGAMLGGAAAITGGAAAFGSSFNMGATSSAPSSTQPPKEDVISSSQSADSVSQQPMFGVNSASSPSSISALPLPSKTEAISSAASKMPNPAFSPSLPSLSEDGRERKKTADLKAESVSKNLGKSDSKSSFNNFEPSAPSSVSGLLGGTPNTGASDPLGFSSQVDETNNDLFSSPAPAVSSSNGLNGSAASFLNNPESKVEDRQEDTLKGKADFENSSSCADKPIESTPCSKVKSIKPREFEQNTVGFLLSFDNSDFGELYELSTGRWLLTSRPTEQDDYILIEDKSISPLHAIIRASDDGKIQILDQLSEFGTGLLRSGGEKEEDVSGTMITVDSGDVIRFGKRYFVVTLFPDAANKLASSKD